MFLFIINLKKLFLRDHKLSFYDLVEFIKKSLLEFIY